MKCPNDNATLLITDRNGIEIDYCPECRGVWLDRGELDKLIERSGQTMPQARSHYEDRDYRDNDDHRRDHVQHSNYHHKKLKKENFLEDFFDFG